MPDNNISQLVGERIAVNSRTVQVVKELGEGGFSFVYLVKEEPSASSLTTDVQSPSASAEMVLKILHRARSLANQLPKKCTHGTLVAFVQLGH